MAKTLSKIPIQLSEGTIQMMKVEAEEKSKRMRMKRLAKTDPEYIRIKKHRDSQAHGLRVIRQYYKANKSK
ncbi:MAG: hypothetical protein ABII64_02485 [Elusimicrobiota bacterium]